MPCGQAGAASSPGPGCKRRCGAASIRSCRPSSGGGSAGTTTDPPGGRWQARPLRGRHPRHCRLTPICAADDPFWPLFCIAYPLQTFELGLRQGGQRGIEVVWHYCLRPMPSWFWRSGCIFCDPLTLFLGRNWLCVSISQTVCNCISHLKISSNHNLNNFAPTNISP